MADAPPVAVDLYARRVAFLCEACGDQLGCADRSDPQIREWWASHALPTLAQIELVTAAGTPAGVWRRRPADAVQVAPLR